jgi:hypothetical protein
LILVIAARAAVAADTSNESGGVELGAMAVRFMKAAASALLNTKPCSRALLRTVLGDR